MDKVDNIKKDDFKKPTIKYKELISSIQNNSRLPVTNETSEWNRVSAVEAGIESEHCNTLGRGVSETISAWSIFAISISVGSQNEISIH